MQRFSILVQFFDFPAATGLDPVKMRTRLAIVRLLRKWGVRVDLDGSPRQLRMLLNPIIKHSRRGGIGNLTSPSMFRPHFL